MLCFYTLFTAFRVYKHTKKVHLILQEEALQFIDDDPDNSPYKRAMDLVIKRANADLNGYVEIPDDKKHWKSDPGEYL